MFSVIRNNKKAAWLLLAIWAVQLAAQPVLAFCGFYVASAGAELFNEKSQVILARHGKHTVLTMSSDYKGSVQHFAMVVPVPVVLQRNQIRTVDPDIFAKLDAYSAPRLVEYPDDPCPREAYPAAAAADSAGGVAHSAEMGVKIEAQYEVGEYSILILSATESTGLKNWLVANNYSIPQQAEEVLDPYIKNNLKFFVVKVNLARYNAGKGKELSPIQIEYDSERFMLPIRLGMANARGPQDLIVYALSAKGRVECTNYSTVEMPTGVSIPEYIKTDNLFGPFYKAVFDKQYHKYQRKAVFLEYFWNISGNQWQKCDPCTGDPPNGLALVRSGASWLKLEGRQPGGTVPPDARYTGEIYFTRLHVRYEKAGFPEDLLFQETPNKENYQARYPIYLADKLGALSCMSAKEYQEKWIKRERQLLQNLAVLTDWNTAGTAGKAYAAEHKKWLAKADGADLSATDVPAATAEPEAIRTPYEDTPADETLVEKRRGLSTLEMTLIGVIAVMAIGGGIAAVRWARRNRQV